MAALEVSASSSVSLAAVVSRSLCMELVHGSLCAHIVAKIGAGPPQLDRHRFTHHRHTSHTCSVAPQVPIIAVDLLNFNMFWPWPLFNRIHGPKRVEELMNLHAFHLHWTVATNASFWMHLHNYSTVIHVPCLRLERRGSLPPPTVPLLPTYSRDHVFYCWCYQESLPVAPLTSPRLRCRHAPDAVVARQILDRWVRTNISLNGGGPGRWMAAQVKQTFEKSSISSSSGSSRGGASVPPDADPQLPRQRLLPDDYLYCGMVCLPNTVHCQKEWSELRRV